MPGLSPNAWQGRAGLLRFDYVLLRGPVGLAIERDRGLRLVAKDGDFALFSVCGGGEPSNKLASWWLALGSNSSTTTHNWLRYSLTTRLAS